MSSIVCSLFLRPIASVLCALLCVLGVLTTSHLLAEKPDPAASDARRTVVVEGFETVYESIATPSGESADSQPIETWLTGFQAVLTSRQGLAYRDGVLPPGTHDVWVEKGKGEWFHLVVGRRADEDTPRLRAMFRLYEQEKAVKEVGFALKLVSKGTKLKFSLTAGSFEGHGNLRVVLPSAEDESSDER